MNNATAFIDAARPVFGTVSGSPVTGLRIAVRNITSYRRVAALAEQYRGTIAPTTGRYPELARITFAPACDACGAPKPAGQSCGCFDNGSE